MVHGGLYNMEMQHVEIAIAGAGIIGLTLALELRQRGHSVVAFDAGHAGFASTAAAGMLAARDPENNPALAGLATLSLKLYPDLLQRIASLSGETVAIQTRATLQHTSTMMRDAEQVEAHQVLPALAPNSFYLLQEESLDPRQLYRALKKAAVAAGVSILAQEVIRTNETPSHVMVHSKQGALQADGCIDCTGAWSLDGSLSVHPVKGQMLRVRLQDAPLRSEEYGNLVLRGEEIYIVPRLDGSALIGATVEPESGYDLNVDPSAIDWLREKAAAFLPSVRNAEQIETWAGLRPRLRGTDLPFMGAVSERRFVSTGHFRNGILLAPASAVVMADIVEGEQPQVDLSPFLPQAHAR